MEALSDVTHQPRAGWEVFDSPKVGRIVGDDSGDAEVPAATTTDADDVNAQKEAAERERIFSMFQASRPSTGDAEAMSRPSATSDRRCRPMTALSQVSRNAERTYGSVFKAIFSIDKISYDVDLYDDRITWCPVSQIDARKPYSQLEDLKQLPLVKRGVVYLHEICSVRLKNIRNVSAKTVTTIGFAIITALQKGDKLREQSTLFLCYSREVCIQWATRIKSIIMARSERPKRVLILMMQSFTNQDIWSEVIQAQLQTVGITGKLTDIHKSNSVSEYVQKVLSEQAISQDAESYDGILALGRTAFFSEVLQTMLQFKKQVLKSGAWHPQIPTLGLIPTSSMSYIGKEMYGCSDAETALFHAIYGCKQSIDVCSFYDKDGNFLRHGLTASYGFSGGDTASKGIGVIQSSIKKGLAITKAIVQRRLYPCEIRYKDSPQTYEPFNDDEIFAEEEFSKFSIVNHHYINDDDSHHYDVIMGNNGHLHGSTADENNQHRDQLAVDGPGILATDQVPSDSDSRVWPQLAKWDVVPRRNYLDIMVTSLPQYDTEGLGHECPLSTILVRETMSRKELLRGMGSQVSLSSKTGKSKPEILEKTDVLRGSEFIIKPCGEQGTSASNCLSQWTIDDVCIDSAIQELHVKVADFPMQMYARAPGQPLSVPVKVDTLKLMSDNAEVALDSVA